VALVSADGTKRKQGPSGAPPPHSGNGLSARFGRWSRKAARVVGHPATFLTAVAFVVTWAVTGPLFGFSDAWQLVINTTTTILTFLMIFLLQNSQNRDTDALELKLDEVIRALEGARNSMLAVEELDDEQRARMREAFEALGERSRDGEREGEGTEGEGAAPEPEERRAPAKR
jgi:low affinity Fe/Cu permease